MITLENDILFMKRAIELARLGMLSTRPNPMVGAVIVHNNNIIGEGFHLKAGDPHAEVNAIRSAPAELLKESSIYVTLEPCSHHGRTPPCASLLAEKSFKRVVIGCKDTSKKVSGKGIDILRKGGCDVTVGVLEEECRELNKRFLNFHEKDRPYVILKWAESADGFIDMDRGQIYTKGPNWITGHDERVLVHKWRAEEQSILVGKNTLLNDNPELSVRYWEGPDPLRLVLIDSATLPEGLKMIEDDKPLLLFSRHAFALEGIKENILVDTKESAITDVLKELHRREIQSLIVEGGANILCQFIEQKLWNEARIFKGKSEFGSGIVAPLINGTQTDTQEFENSTLIYLKP